MLNLKKKEFKITATAALKLMCPPVLISELAGVGLGGRALTISVFSCHKYCVMSMYLEKKSIKILFKKVLVFAALQNSTICGNIR